MKLDLTSTTIEKSLDFAKEFLGKLISPSVEETGLLIKDTIASYRFKNQIKILNKAKEYCEKNNISPKQISFKLLCPLLEYASLEENEKLQDKWSILISNLADSEQNIENHVFPYILSQISLKEFEIIEKTMILKKEKVNKLQQELETHLKELPEKSEKIRKEIKKNESEFLVKFRFEKKLRDLQNKKREILIEIEKQQILESNKLKEFEISNLIRLGIIKNVIKHSAYANSVEFPSLEEIEYGNGSSQDLEIEIEEDYEFQNLTELGELFIKSCIEKNSSQHSHITNRI
tara:strand:- start:59 stop:928 length:870 start_codon:yes stop_codon:yes gene_type:complete